jgi:hypothetical protein
MAYPLAFGYSLVGHVVECGANVEDADSLMESLSLPFLLMQVITDRWSSGSMVADPLDAIFMPSVETALSIVHSRCTSSNGRGCVWSRGDWTTCNHITR